MRDRRAGARRAGWFGRGTAPTGRAAPMRRRRARKAGPRT
ncbi:hypothetical protein C7S17_3068 [Burkholderia thailandensis]|nr:hypothetical protein [Burkholderia thailandensis]